MARHSEYNEQVASDICSWLVEGKSIASYCKLENTPSVQTIYTWLAKYPKFLELYTRAKEDSADTLSDEMLDIADEQCTTVKHGEGDSEREVEIVFDSTAVARNRLRVETRKWIASKLKPKKYGDKVELDAKVEHSGELLHTVGFETSAQELLNKIR